MFWIEGVGIFVSQIYYNACLSFSSQHWIVKITWVSCSSHRTDFMYNINVKLDAQRNVPARSCDELNADIEPCRLLRSTVTMFPKSYRAFTRQLSTNTAAYPFSKVVILPPLPAVPASQVEALRNGKGIMAYLQKSLPHPTKQKWLATWFARRHPDRLLPGSVLSITLEHAPTTFSGVLLSIRRRGPDTSFTLRNVIQRTGVEMQFFVNSPHVKDIKILQRAGGGGGKEGRRQRRAKLFFLRDTPEKMTAISAGVKA